ncbi:MAG: SusC/RagA family TonB-linked outer membrane protein [Bacteroidota bacterium]
MRKIAYAQKLSGLFLGGQLLFFAAAYAQNTYAKINKDKEVHYSGGTVSADTDRKKTPKQTLLNALKNLNRERGIYFLFSQPALADILVPEIRNSKNNVGHILDEMLKSTGLSYKKMNEKTYVILSDAEKAGGDTNNEMQTTSHTYIPLAEIAPDEKSETITGRVTGDGGVALSGVSIQVKGTNRGTSTNANGDFSIEANKGDILVISYVGYDAREFTVGDSRTLSISLTLQNLQLNEVVVTALGIKKETRRLGYSVTKVAGEEFTKSREINVANALVGKIAGVNSSGPLTGPGGSSNVLIRGMSSLSGGRPLYVINGIPFNNNNFGSAGMWGGADLGEGLTSLNPDDIEEITVLKGGAAAALYGQQALGGVIMITTKSGKGKKGLGIEINSNVQIDQINNFLEFQNVYGQGTLNAKPVDATSAKNTGLLSWGAKLDGSLSPIFDGSMKPYSAQGDNLDRFYKTGSTFSNTVSITSGNETGNFRLSLSDLRNHGVYPNSKYTRNTVGLDANYKLSEKWSGQASLLYSKEDGKNRTNLSDAPGNGNYAINFLPPNVSAAYLGTGYDATGKEIEYNGDAFTTNPFFAANKFQNNTSKNRTFAVASLRYSPLKWLYVQGRFGNDNYSFNGVQITPTGTAYRNAGSLDNDINWFYNQANFDVLVGINRSITKDIAVNFTAGANLLKERQKINTINASGLAFPYLYNPGAATSNNAVTTTPQKDVRSVYGSLELSYKNFLFLNITDRNDWSSTIPIGNNSYNYPSANLAYVFSENFKPTWLSFGKIRIGYAQVGRDADPFQTALYYNSSGSINGQPIGSLPTVIPNKNLEPLQAKEFEMGTMLSLFKSRASVDFTWYKKNTLNDIVQGTVSQTSGYNAAIVNIGKVQNQGIEIMLGGSPVKGKKFTWNTSFNFANNKNKIVQLAEGQKFMSLGQSRTTRGFTQHRLGMPAFQVMVYDFKKDPAKGNALVVNASGFPQAADDLMAAGTSIHPTTGGWNNSLKYKNFDLEFLIDYKYGAYIYSGTNARAYGNGLHTETLNGRDAGISVTGVTAAGNPVTTTISAQNYYGALSGISLLQTYKADFIKFRSLTLSYNVPVSRILKSKIKEMSISLVGRNLFYIKRSTPNIDPEANYSNNTSVGLEYASLPSVKSYGLNLNVKF